jgi:hypothetical protein
MLGDIAILIMSSSLLILPIFGYFAIKNNWKIVDWF